jgi:hypothetical protein
MFLPLEGVRRQPEFREAPQEALEDDLSLQPDERCADAEVNPHTKSEMTSFIAGDVEAIGIFKSLRVAVCRPNNGVYQVSFADARPFISASCSAER